MVCEKVEQGVIFWGKRIKFKKPLLFFERFFFRLVRKRDSILAYLRKLTSSSEEERERERKRERAKEGGAFCSICVCFFFPSSFLIEEARKRAHDARVYIYEWVPPPPPLCPS